MIWMYNLLAPNSQLESTKDKVGHIETSVDIVVCIN
jgi:hypothetical protein